MEKYYDNHYAEMSVQPIEVMQEIMSPEAFGGFLLGNAIKYHIRAGHKVGEDIEKEIAKRDRYISWRYHARKGERIDPKKDYYCPGYYVADTVATIDRKLSEMRTARIYGEDK